MGPVILQNAPQFWCFWYFLGTFQWLSQSRILLQCGRHRFHTSLDPSVFPESSDGKESSCNARDPASIPGLGRSAGEGTGYLLQSSWASRVAQLVKNPPAMWETWFDPWLGKILWRRERLPTPVFCPGEFHGLFRPWGCEESDTTEWLFTFHFRPQLFKDTL